MRPDLVLDEDDKKKRFKKLKVVAAVSEVEILDSNDEDEIQVVQDIPNKSAKKVQKLNPKSKRQKTDHISPERKRSNSISLQTMPPFQTSPPQKKNISRTILWSGDDSEESDDELPPLPPAVIDDDDSNDCLQEDSFLDPETGLVIGAKTSPSPGKHEEESRSDEDVQSLPSTVDIKNVDTYSEGIISDRSLVIQSSTIASKNQNENNQGEDHISSRIIKNCPTPNTNLLMKENIHQSQEDAINDIDINHFRSPDTTREIIEQEVNNCTEDDLIRRYVHKKFRSIENKPIPTNSQFLDENHSIKKITICNKPELKNNQQQQPFNQGLQQTRRSVIVQRVEEKPQIQIEFHMKKSEDEELRDQIDDFVISFNIEEIETLYTNEEAKYFDKFQSNFGDKWNAIPFGEEMMSHYIQFGQRKQELNPRFFELINNQLKVRVLNFLFSGDDMDGLSSSYQFSLLKRHLPEAMVLVKLVGFNIKNVQDELDFVFTRRDLEQFRACPGAQAIKIGELLKYAPFPDIMKKTIFGLMVSCAHPILGDTKVFTMMLMLIIFRDDEHQHIVKVRDQYWTMLRRHLARRADSYMGVEFLLSKISICLNILPLMTQPFRQLGYLSYC